MDKTLKTGLICGIGIGLMASTTASFANTNVPPHQSKCEVRLNAYRKAHPKADPWEMMNQGGFFGDAHPPGPPLEYRDETSGLTIRTGSDGRQVIAIDKDGTTVWDRDPFVDSDLCPYRSAHPMIVWIGAPGGGFGWHYLEPFVATPDEEANAQVRRNIKEIQSRGFEKGDVNDADRFIGLTFDSSQFGYVNVRTGDFFFGGQN